MGEKRLILDPSELKQIFSEKKREILNSLYIKDYDSISELADDLDRNYSIVNRDLSKLEDVGVIKLKNNNGKKKPVLVDPEIRVRTFKAIDLYPLPEISNKEIPSGSDNLLEKTEGEKFGEYIDEGVYLDRWDLEKSGNQVTIGRIGHGKSYAAKLNIIRTYKNRDDVKVVMIDNLGGFSVLNRFLDGTKISVGENSNRINPMHISETPVEALDKNPKLDPYEQKVKSLLEFFDMFFENINIGLEEFDRRILELAIREVYSDYSINREISTHSNESPTVEDLIDKINDILNNPADYSDTNNEGHIKDIESHASKMLPDIAEFKEFEEYSLFSEKNTFNIEENDIWYFDLSEVKGSYSKRGHNHKINLSTHALIDNIYQESMRTDKKILLVVDEAHHILKDIKEDYQFIQTVLENSKDFDLSVNFITQNPNDFNTNVRTRKILQKCPLRLLFKMDEEIDEEISSILKIKENHMDYLNSSHPGSKERGYSEALLGVEEDYIPITIKSNEDEKSILALENTETWRDIQENTN